MELHNRGPDARQALDEALGYLNLSSGTPDVGFQRNLAILAGLLESGAGVLRAVEPGEKVPDEGWLAMRDLLRVRLAELAGSSAAFRETGQAEAVLDLAFVSLPTAYSRWHSDLLRHQPRENLFRPFFLARACEAVLRQGGPWHEEERIVRGALEELNDFIGHRPVAVLETKQQVEPYDHEWVAPVPLYLREAGVAPGLYHDLVEQALAILAATDADISEQAQFDLGLLDELAFDPRAYDFDHPVNKRPNYQFGQWDPHQIDGQGRYRRFVLQEITLAALEEQVGQRSAREHLVGGELSDAQTAAAEALFEAAAVLAGTILMASGISGRGPGSHDSSVTLATLLPTIAACRDAFYQRLLNSIGGKHGERLRSEASRLGQPFGSARQRLNQGLARLRAVQLQHVHLAQIFARIGYPEASSRQAETVEVCSARMLCEINGGLTAGHHLIDRGELSEAARQLPVVEDLLHRGIECGALVDPWNILGTHGQFSLFPALENSVHDHRVDVLIHLVRMILGLATRLHSEAAAQGDRALGSEIASRLRRFATWWDEFATTAVSGVEHVSGLEALESSHHVAKALSAWKEAGAAAGDVGFWRQHAMNLDSPKSYALVVATLLEQHDRIASMALLMQWIGQAGNTPLTDGDHSFHELAIRWFTLPSENSSATAGAATAGEPRVTWSLARKFLDYLEANADEWWDVPQLDVRGNAARGRRGNLPRGRSSQQPPDDDSDDAKSSRDRTDDLFGDEDETGDDLLDGGEYDEADRDDEPSGLFRAAYDDVTYRDSTDDGFDADMLEGGGPATEFELDAEARRVGERLDFLITVARLWKLAVGSAVAPGQPDETSDAIATWLERARHNRHELERLLERVNGWSLGKPGTTREMLLEYDRRRHVQESLAARIILATVETASAAAWLSACLDPTPPASGLADWELQVVAALRAMFRGETDTVRNEFPALTETLAKQSILYVPLARHGEGSAIVAAKVVQRHLMTLLRGMPGLGLLHETIHLIGTAQEMERHRPPGEGAVTEFDRLFEVGFRHVVEALAASAHAEPNQANDIELLETLQALTEHLLKRWVAHSRSLRLSVLERVQDDETWSTLRGFVVRYGRDIFTPRFMNLGNLRAILHQGVGTFLRAFEEDPTSAPDWRLLAEIGHGITREAAAEQLTLAIEAVVENYSEFKDFNSTTTQSDRGELLHVLLDLLRLKASYERVAWNIRPVTVVHDALVRHGWLAEAEAWRRAVALRTSQLADWHLKKLTDLEQRHSVRLPTIADRLGERFIRALAIDRVRALVRPAIESARLGRGDQAFESLEAELVDFIEHPSGAGLDVPAWIIAIEEEVALAGRLPEGVPGMSDFAPPAPRRILPWEEVRRQARGEE